MEFKMRERLVASAVVGTLLARYAPRYSLGIISNFLLLSIIFWAGALLWKAVLYPKYFSKLRHIPDAPGWKFFTGHTIKLFKASSGLPQCEWVETVPNDGLIRYSMFGKERLLVTSPKALAEVLVTRSYDFIKPPQFRNDLGRTLGIGILLAEGDEHKRQRKNLMPAFAYRHIKDLYPVFWSKAREMTDCVVEEIAQNEASAEKNDVKVDEKEVQADAPKHGPRVVEVGNWSARATLDIIGLAGMGQDFDSLHDEDNKLSKTYRSLFNIDRINLALRLVFILLPFWFVSRLPVKRNKEINDASAYVKQVCRDMIAKKREEITEKGRTSVDIISVALESGGFTDEELVNQMMTFLVAGHETTATAMVWAVYSLCKHPEIQKKLREELQAQLPSVDQEITAAQIDNCQYLKAVCNEVLRLWSPVSLTLRVSACDTQIGDTFIPKGTIIIFSPWAVNSSTELWGPDAKEFKPERWLDADGKANNKGGADSNYSFLTFLHGPRSCIGQKFAQAEFECLIAAWFRRFDTAFEEGSAISKGEYELGVGIAAKPKGGLWVQVTEVGA